MKPENVSTKQERIAKLARSNPAMALISLNHYLDHEWVRYAYECTRKDGAVGVDGQTAEEYAANLEQNLLSLIDRLKSGQENLDILRWCFDWGIQTGPVVDILTALDINSRRLAHQFDPAP